MLHVNGLTYRIGDRLLLDRASFAVPDGARVGLVGRNGAGKTTLFRIILGDVAPESGDVEPAARSPASAPWRRRRPPGRSASSTWCSRPTRSARRSSPKQRRPTASAAPRSRPASPTSARTPRRRGPPPSCTASASTLRRSSGPAPILLGRLAHARRARRRAVRRAGPAAARRADQLPRPRRHALALRLSRALPAHGADHQPRPRPARHLRRPHPAPRPRQADCLSRRLLVVRAATAEKQALQAKLRGEAGGRAQASASVRRPLPRQGVEGPPSAIARQAARQAGADRGAGRGRDLLAFRLCRARSGR